eukprot:8107613-Pyramimonas_sp.AAC.1
MKIFEKSLFFHSASIPSLHSCQWKELYEVPRGDQVDGSPPAPVREEAGGCACAAAPFRPPHVPFRGSS